MFHSKGHIGESLTMPQNYFRRQVTKRTLESFVFIVL